MNPCVLIQIRGALPGIETVYVGGRKFLEAAFGPFKHQRYAVRTVLRDNHIKYRKKLGVKHSFICLALWFK